ncbi:hypothetical protein [Nesterenkonia ebinurensis]|uniref:hypothetical protein n=1 Tax=Nesterenkonia ebinurensis TaxID=2608252 RepID=UPI00123DC976|nr:hypothetical protein [Nesterenkonia ebinurensis]
MNPQPQHQQRSHPHDPHGPRGLNARRQPVPGSQNGKARSPEAAGTPEAVQAARIQRDQAKHAAHERRAGGGVAWVRPSDLIARGSASLAGRGIDFETELARKARAPMVAGATHLGERAKHLPPLQAFGRGHAGQSPTRSAVGRA